MTDAVYPVPEEWARKALIDADRYAAMYRELVEDPESFWRREAQRIDWIRPFTKVKETSFDEADFGIRWFADGTLNLSANCLDRHLADARRHRPRSSGSPTIRPKQGRTISYRRAAPPGLPLRQCAQGQWRQARRPRHHLHADGARGGGGDAGLRADRGDPFGGVRRLLARSAGRPDPGLRQHDRRHRRRGPARWQADPAQGQCRRGAAPLHVVRPGDRPQAHRQAGADAGWTRRRLG